MEDFQFKDTTATKKIFALKKKIRAVYGGTGASKTVSIVVWCIDYAQSTRNKIVSIVGESYPHLELGAIRVFKSVMKDRGYWKESEWNETKHVYTFENGTIIEFLSIDKLGKAHGPRRNVLYINECNYVEFNIADQLMTRTSDVIWLDWNPTSDFWYYSEIEGKRDDIDPLKLTFLDNEGLPDNEKQEILARQNRTSWWNVYGLGNKGEIEGLIYPGWKVIDEVPTEARLERRWQDYGYTNDPSAIGDLYKWNDAFILDEQLYQKGLSNKQLSEFILNLPQPKTLVIADSAEPKSIDEMRSFGINIMPSEKGKDSVRQGIQIVQDQNIFVTRRSVNILKEQRNYTWLVDRDGRVLNVEDPKCANHHMAGIRYAFRSLIPIIRRKEILAAMPRMPVFQHRKTV